MSLYHHRQIRIPTYLWPGIQHELCAPIDIVCSYLATRVSLFVLIAWRNGKQLCPCQNHPNNSFTVFVSRQWPSTLKCVNSGNLYSRPLRSWFISTLSVGSMWSYHNMAFLLYFYYMCTLPSGWVLSFPSSNTCAPNPYCTWTRSLGTQVKPRCFRPVETRV